MNKFGKKWRAKFQSFDKKKEKREKKSKKILKSYIMII